MKRVKLLATAMVLAVLAVMASRVIAQETNTLERTFLTFSGSVEMPGVTLQPGTYVFKLADTPTRNVVQVWDAQTFQRIKTIPVGKGAYNVEPSSDGRVVVVTNKKDQSISLIDAARLVETARIPTSKKVVHGVAYSPDSKLAYVSCESIGADAGAVDVIDLGRRKRIGSIAIAGQPTGITLLSSGSTYPRP